ncbi:MAG: hypothetical protein AB7S38_40565 [Vulcanimicrobiota bacterium]
MTFRLVKYAGLVLMTLLVVGALSPAAQAMPMDCSDMSCCCPPADCPCQMSCVPDHRQGALTTPAVAFASPLPERIWGLDPSAPLSAFRLKPSPRSCGPGDDERGLLLTLRLPPPLRMS